MGKKINILFAPSNTASMPDITLQALNRRSDINAKGISLGSTMYWSFGENWKIIELSSLRKHPFKRIGQYLSYKFAIAKGILWADILMWHWDIDTFEYYLIKLLRKPIFVEWIGSDIRVPEIVFRENHYYKDAWENGDWDYKMESRERSHRIQKKFYQLKAMPTVCVEISLHLNRTFFPKHITFYQRIDIRNYHAAYPSPDTKIPVLVHTPSATGTKGTRYVREAIEQLRSKGLQFEYVEIHNKTRQEALNAILQADIFIDQFIVGSYGLATCEAMAMGKPVLCYLMDSVTQLLPAECPIVNTNLDNLLTTLETFISDASLRYETGKRSRAFAEQYHDADKIAVQLATLYKETLHIN